MSSKAPLRALLKQFFTKFKGPILVGIGSVIAVDSADLILPILLKRIVDSFADHTTKEILPGVFFGMLGIIIVQVLCRYLWRISIIRSSMKTGADLRRIFSSQLFQVPLGFYDRRKVGELMTLATSDIENMRMALGPGMIGLVDSLFYCITIPIAIYLVLPDHSLYFILPALCIPFVMIFLQRKISDISKKVQTEIAEISTQTQEVVAGARVARIFGVDPQLEERLRIQSKKLNVQQINLASAQALLGPSLEFFISICLVLLFSMGLNFSIGTLVALQRYLQRLMIPLASAGMSVVHFQRAKSSGVQFYKILEEELSDLMNEDATVTGDSLILANEHLNKPLIEIKNLTFTYPLGSQDRPVINNLSFVLNRGEWLGIEGSVASGKSTLLGLLLKFYPVSRGQIFILGKDIQDWDSIQLRKLFSPVLQDPYLFQGSIQYNLAVGTALSESDALEVAGIKVALDSRLGEELGERGSGLSGGQKQRIAIARSFRKPASVYLFDDPLSSVDLVTSTRVLKSITKELREKNKTVIFASHHPEHLKYCDRVIRLGVTDA